MIDVNIQNIQPRTSRLVHTHQEVTCENFFDIWFADGPIYGAIHGPRLAGNNKPDWQSDRPHWKRSRKKVEGDWADIDYFVGKRFNGQTSYVMFDIDCSSQYHPNNGLAQYDRMLEALEGIGLVRSVVVRSSHGGGLHIYFPLGQQVKTWITAKKLHDHLIAQNFTIKNGTLELFPNPKADRNAQYNGHRLPLQSGSYLLDEDFQVWSGDRHDFLNAWNAAAAGNALDFTSALVERREVLETPHDNLPLIVWTASHQSNEILRELANWGYEREHLRTAPKLGDWMKAIAPQLPGYQQFTSSNTKRDIQSNWCYRWARSRVRHGGGAASSNSNLNHERAEQATQRLQSVLADLAGQFWSSANKLFHKVYELVQKRFGIGISKQTFQSRKGLWNNLLKPSSGLQTSSKNQETQNQSEKGYKHSTSATPSPTRNTSTVDNQNPCVQVDGARNSVVHTSRDLGACESNSMQRVSKIQLKDLPNPDTIMATGAELKAAGIEGYGLHHNWAIRRGEYSADLWNRLRFVAFRGESC